MKGHALNCLGCISHLREMHAFRGRYSYICTIAYSISVGRPLWVHTGVTACMREHWGKQTNEHKQPKLHIPFPRSDCFSKFLSIHLCISASTVSTRRVFVADVELGAKLFLGLPQQGAIPGRDRARSFLKLVQCVSGPV